MPRPLPAVLSVCCVFAFAGCSGSVGTSAEDDRPSSAAGTGSHSRAPAVAPAAPKAGVCRNVNFGDVSLFSNDSLPVPCSKPHTAYTFDVEELPGDVAFEGVEIKNDAVQDAAAAACTDSYVGFIGGSTSTRALARLTVTYFVPDQEGFDAGAHWVRCDVVALQSESSLAALPGRLEGYLDRDDALDQYGVCSRGNPSEPGSALVMCTQEHTYRAVDALRLGETDSPYPGEKQALDDGQQQCEDLLKEELGVGGGFTYVWTYPSAQDWADGQRFGYCWNESTS